MYTTFYTNQRAQKLMDTNVQTPLGLKLEKLGGVGFKQNYYMNKRLDGGVRKSVSRVLTNRKMKWKN